MNARASAIHHIDGERLAELATARAAGLTASERDHLHRCQSCTSQLADELALTHRLRAAPQPRAPLAFAETTRRRFLAARRARYRAAFMQTAAAVALLAISTTTLLVLAWPHLIAHAGVALSASAAIMKAFALVAVKLPGSAMAFVAVQAVTLLGTTLFLIALVRREDLSRAAAK